MREKINFNFLVAILFLILSFWFYTGWVKAQEDDELQYLTAPPGAQWGIIIPSGSSGHDYEIECIGNVIQVSDGGYVVIYITRWHTQAGVSVYRTGLTKINSLNPQRIEWSEVYPSIPTGTESESYSALFVTPAQDGGYIMTGALSSPLSLTASPHLWLMKVDQDGKIEWERRFDYNGDDVNPEQCTEWGKSVIEVFNGYYIAGGYKYGMEEKGWLFFIAKDEQGRPTGEPLFLINTSYPINWMELTPDGGFILATGSNFKNTGEIIKLNNQFEEEWKLRDKYYYHVKPTSDGGFIATGTDSKIKLIVTKIASDGDIIWKHEFEKENSFPVEGHSVVETDDGGFLIVGTPGIWLLKLDSKSMVWDLTYRYSLKGFSIIKTDDGNYLIAGMSKCCNEDRIWLIKLRGDFNPQYPQALFNIAPEEAIVNQKIKFDASASTDPDGNIVSYEWNFGDGTIQTTTNPIVFHCYGSPGQYEVKLTVRDNNDMTKTTTKTLIVSPMQIRWEQIIGESTYNVGYSMIKSQDGGFVITGYKYNSSRNYSDLWVFKTDRLGRIVYREDGNPWGFLKYYPDEISGRWASAVGYDIIHTPDGGYVVIGNLCYYPQNNDIWLIKINENGIIEWEKTFGGEWSEFGKGVVSTKNGYVITGYTESFGEGGNARVWLINTDQNGNEIWDSTFSADKYNRATGYGIISTSDGGYLIVGSEGVSSDQAKPGIPSKALVIKIDDQGNEIWRKTFGTGRREFFRWAHEIEDGFLMAGSLDKDGENYAVLAKVKVRKNGDEWIVQNEWIRYYDHHMHDTDEYIFSEGEIYSGLSTSDGGYIFVGTIKCGANDDIWIIKTDAEGNFQWDFIYGKPDAEEIGFDIVSPEENKYVILGSSNISGNVKVLLFEIGPQVQPLSATLTTAYMEQSGEPDSGDAPLDVYFHVNFSGGIPPYTYDLDVDGDGIWDEKNIQNLWEYCFTYYKPGKYQPKVKVTDALGNTAEATLDSWIEVYGNPIADFNAHPVSGHAPLTVFFDIRPTSWGYPISFPLTYDLDIDGDGNFEFTDESYQVWEPYWEYDEPGIYSVILKVKNGEGKTSTMTKQNLIVVSGIKALSSNVSITESHVTSDPINEPELFDLTNVPLGVDLTNSQAFTLNATGQDGCYKFYIIFDQPITDDFVLYKLPDWQEIDYSLIDQYTIEVELCIENGILDPSFILAKNKTMYTLTIRVEGNGNTIPPAGTYEFPEGEVIEIIAQPSENDKFLGWEGDVSGTQTHIDIIMDSNKEIIATFSGTTNQIPSVSEPLPENNKINVSLSPELSVLVSDPEKDKMVVTFYNAITNDVIGTVSNVTSDTRVAITWSGLNYNTTYSWYVKVSDGVNEIISDTWSFTTTSQQIEAGDANADGRINVQDVISIINVILGRQQASGNADCNGDGSVNVQDVICVINKILNG